MNRQVPSVLRVSHQGIATVFKRDRPTRAVYGGTDQTLSWESRSEQIQHLSSASRYLKSNTRGDAEMAQGLKALATLPEDHSSSPSTHTMTHNHLQFLFQSIQCPLLASVGSACTWYTDMHSGKHPCTYQMSLMSSTRMNIVTEVADICETTYLLEGQERFPKVSG